MLSAYHKEALGNLKPNRSVTLNRRKGQWWPTLTTTQALPQPDPSQPRGTVGVDIGLCNTLTDSTGQHYGAFSAALRQAHERERAKRQRKAKLRACLAKKGCARLPSLRSATGERLA